MLLFGGSFLATLAAQAALPAILFWPLFILSQIFMWGLIAYITVKQFFGWLFGAQKPVPAPTGTYTSADYFEDCLNGRMTFDPGWQGEKPAKRKKRKT